MPGPREFHGSVLPVPKTARLSFGSMSAFSHIAPPPYDEPVPGACVHVSLPGAPGRGTVVQLQTRAPVVASRACMLLLGLPPSPPLSPTMSRPLKYIGVAETRPPFCHGSSSVFQTRPPVVWSRATTLPSRWVA